MSEASILATQDYLVELNNLPSRVVDSDFAALPSGRRRQLSRNRQKRVHYQEPTSETVCDTCGADQNLERHHIIPPKLGGRNVKENIVWLCHKCHTEYHGGE